jgi:N-acetylglutamate synthase-like GNAT family acetyltransferase
MPQTITPKISACSADDFTTVCQLISKFCLDDNDLKAEQFMVAKQGERLLGFGRLRTYNGCSELCSLGVIEGFRLMGIGSQISKVLIEKSLSPLYTVTIIPGFFERLGFQTTETFPSEIRTKLNYCISALAVPEKYVVMRHI